MLRAAYRLILRYPFVAATITAGLIGLLMTAVGRGDTASWIIGGYALLVAAWQLVDMVRSLLRGHLGIDILAISAIVATVAVGEHWAALMVALMLTGGEALEDYAGRRSKRDLDALLQRAPIRAHVIAPDGSLREVPVEGIAVGDAVLVRPGEVVSVDGVLDSEAGSFDESQLTGESLPVDRVRGDAVLSGAIAGSSAVTVTATATAANSQYQRIVHLVAEAAESRAPLVRLADRYAVPFTALAYAMGSVAWFLAGDAVRFAQVLVVATPCPLLIATPVAFVAGMSRASRSGIIVKGGGVLEQLSRVRTVAFDKTGTLTYGAPAIERVRPAEGFGDNELLALIAAAEQYSAHVVGAELVAEAARRELVLPTVDEADEVTGRGVRARLGSREVLVGKRAFIVDAGVAIPTAPPETGRMAVYAAVDGRFAGDIEMADPVREEAAASVAALRSLGISRVLMVTGDLAATASHVAREVGVSEVVAECLPEDKVAAIVAVTERPVAMVGDGVNDAPVLAAADIGIAMGARGSTAASESADAVIMVDDVSKVVQAVVIGKQTTMVALQSIWFGIALSVGLMAFAMTGSLPAIVGAALQEVVDLVAIGYALRALVERPHKAASELDSTSRITVQA